MLRHTFVAFAIFGAGISVAAAETPVERGGYLVNAVDGLRRLSYAARAATASI